MEQLIEKLRSPDPCEKRNALESLYDFPCDERVLEAGAYLLTDTDGGVREAASRLLVLCSNEKAASLTAVQIMSDNVAVRNLAGDSLVRMGSAAVTALLPYVDSPDKDVRKFAIDLLAQLPASPETLAKMAARLSDTDQNVVCACIDALGALHAEDHVTQILALFEELEYARPNIVNAATKFPDKVELRFLVNALSDPDPVVQLAAAEALATRKDKDVLKVLIGKLDSVSDLAKPVILHSLVVLLESTDYSEDIPHYLKKYLIETLNDADPIYVRSAVRGLGHFLDKDIIAILISHVGKTESVDNSIFSVLKNQPQEVLSIILTSAKKNNNTTSLVKIIMSLIQSLTKADTLLLNSELMEDTVDFVSGSFEEVDVDTKITTLSTCAKLESPCSVKLVKVGLGDPELAVRSYALDLAMRIGPQSFRRELEKLTEDYDEEIRDAATAILTRLKAGYHNQD